MTTRLRVLIVSPTFPYPPSWGFGMRVYQLARYLAENHEVTLLSYARADEMVHVDPLRELLHEVRVVERPQHHGLVKRVAQLTSIVSRESYQVRDLHTAEMQSAIDDLLSSHAFDIIQLESSQISGFRYEGGGAVVLDEHNIEYELLQRMQDGERSWTRRLYNRVEYRKFRPIEQACWRRVDGCVLTSEREEAIVRSHAPSTPLMVVSNGVDPDFFRPRGLGTEAGTLVFNGLLSYRPNFDAASFLVEEIMPRIAKIRPGVTLTIVGYGNPSELESLKRPNVVLTGMVPDVRTYLERAAVVVVPIRMGGGTRLKVVEALSMSKAVVSTTIGSEGIRVHDGEHLLIADDADAFASSVTGLLADTDRAEALGRAGRVRMVEEYSWKRSAERLEVLFQEIGSRTGGGRAKAPDSTSPDDQSQSR